MKKVRIIKRTDVDGRIKFVIQQKHFLFRMWWVDASLNSWIECRDEFDSLKSAQENLCYFDGSECKEEIVYEKE